MNLTIPRCEPLPDELTVGELYERPCVRGQWVSSRPTWIPVIGTVHQDDGPVNANFEHIHVDYRFLSPTMLEEAKPDEKSAPIFDIHVVHSLPISNVWPEGADGPISLDKPQIGEIAVETWLRKRPCAYQGPYPEYPGHFVPWVKELHRIYRTATLVDGKCPHQGTDLTGIEPDRQGVITCPLHGLRWWAKTGQSAGTPQEPTRRRTATRRPRA